MTKPERKRYEIGEHRWEEDQHILSLCPAPPGWWALFRKSEEEREPIGDRRESIHDLAWVEPVSCFALVEVMEREVVVTGHYDNDIEEWEYTGRTEATVESAGGEATSFERHWPHTMVRPVWWHTGEQAFAGSDEITKPWGHGCPTLIIAPPACLETEWVLERLR